MAHKVALVVGASGMVGANLANHLGGLPGWKALGVSRRRAEGEARFEHLSFDLLDATQCRDVLAKHPSITHVYVAARTKGATGELEEKNNVAVVANVLDALEASAPGLAHVHIVHGTKWYGAHLPNTCPPFREDDARVMPPNPYYAQHDFLAERQKGRGWTWSTSRPSLVFGYSTGYPHNIVCLVGVLAALCRELGTRFRFPGTDGAFRAFQSATDIRLLCRAITFMSQSEIAHNTSFNVSNGDMFTWANLWPRIAKSFGLEDGPPQRFSLAEVLADKEPVWQRIVARHGLKQTSLADLVAWNYGDFHFNREGSDICSLVKLNHIGFQDMTDSEKLFLEMLERYRAEKILPR